MASFGFNIIFYTTEPIIDNPVSKLCIYHKIKSKNNPIGETVWQKILLMFFYNTILSFPVVLTVIYILNPSTVNTNPVSGLSGFDICFIVALLVSGGLLLTLRLIANPTHKGIDFLNKQIIIKRRFFGSIPRIKEIKDIIFSFLSTLFVGTGLYLVLRFCADYLSSNTFQHFFKSYIPTMSLPYLFLYIVAYFEVLFITTTIGELILEKCEPIVQDDVSIIEKYTPYFQE